MPRILIATDSERVLQQVTEALGGDDVSFTICSSGKQVAAAVKERRPDIAVLDLQIGNMGGMAVTMTLRLEESGGRLPHVPAVMLLDRAADVHLARRSGADGWLVKPLDSLRLRRAVKAVLAGDEWTEGVETPAGAGTVAG